jgi:hypothetical protein
MYLIQVDDPELTWTTVGTTHDLAKAVAGLAEVAARFPHRRFQMLYQTAQNTAGSKSSTFQQKPPAKPRQTEEANMANVPLTLADLDEFTEAYIEAALWSSMDNSDPETGGDPVDANWGAEDIAPKTLARMAADCARFQAENADLLALAGEPDQNGHDFWLTRNGHGAGFWDRDYPDEIGDALTAAAEKFGEFDLFVYGGAIEHL